MAKHSSTIVFSAATHLVVVVAAMWALTGTEGAPPKRSLSQTPDFFLTAIAGVFGNLDDGLECITKTKDSRVPVLTESEAKDVKSVIIEYKVVENIVNKPVAKAKEWIGQYDNDERMTEFIVKLVRVQQQLFSCLKNPKSISERP